MHFVVVAPTCGLRSGLRQRGMAMGLMPNPGFHPGLFSDVPLAALRPGRTGIGCHGRWLGRLAAGWACGWPGAVMRELPQQATNEAQKPGKISHGSHGCYGSDG